MMKLNNKGQSLVLFIVIIPIILLVFVLVYDIGTAIYEKNRLSNTSYMVIDYALDNIDSIDENDLISLITKNTDNLSGISVLIDNGNVNVKLTKNIKGVFGRAFKFDLIEAKSEYVGYILDGNKKIDKVGWYYGW